MCIRDRPWANIMLPSTSGTGGANYVASVALRPGDVVIGFFLDGETAQQPVILGAFSRTSDVPQSLPSESIGFVPFTGYTDKIPPPSGTLKANESGSTETTAQESPVTRKTGPNEDKISASSTFGKEEIVADACADNFIGKVSGSLDNLLSLSQEGTDFLSDVSSVTKKIQSLSNNAVSTMMESMYSNMIPELQGGLDALYNRTYATVFAATLNDGLAKTAGIEAQKAQIPKVSALQGALDCLPGKIVDGLGLDLYTEVVNWEEIKDLQDKLKWREAEDKFIFALNNYGKEKSGGYLFYNLVQPYVHKLYLHKKNDQIEKARTLSRQYIVTTKGTLLDNDFIRLFEQIE